MTDFEFEWDPAKDAANHREHGVAFRVATQVFRDPFHTSEVDRIEGGEYRWKTVGCVNGTTFLLVAHTYRDGERNTVVRIISVRKASTQERKSYEHENRHLYI